MNKRTNTILAIGIVLSLILSISALIVATSKPAQATTWKPAIAAHSGNNPTRNRVVADEQARLDGATYADADIWPNSKGALIRTHDKTGVATGEPLTNMLSWAQTHPEQTLMIEWKPTTITTQQAKAYTTLLRQYGVSARVWTVSFHPAVLKTIRAQMSEGRRGLIYSANSPRTLAEVKASGSVALPSVGILTPQRITELHKAGQRVYTWTINTPTDKAKVTGADGILTDNVKAMA